MNYFRIKASVMGFIAGMGCLGMGVRFGKDAIAITLSLCLISYCAGLWTNVPEVQEDTKDQPEGRNSEVGK